MKMAKASEADIEMAMELCGALDALTGHWPTLPTGLCSLSDDERDDRFDCDDDRQCGTVLRHLLAIAERAGLMRVVFGMAVVLDPRNEVIDPDADTLETHPKVAAAELDADRYRVLRAGHAQAMCANLYGQDVPCDTPTDWGRELDEWVDAKLHTDALDFAARASIEGAKP